MSPTSSDPVPRQPIHTRQISCRAYRRADGLFEIEGTLSDEKAQTVPFRSRDPVPAGSYMHHMTMTLVIDGDYTIRSATARTLQGPWPACGGVDASYAGLAGLRIGAGFNQDVRQRLGGIHGCTHLTDLLAQIANTYMQASWPDRIAAQLAVAADPRQWPDQSTLRFVGKCHAWREDGETLQREYPELLPDDAGKR